MSILGELQEELEHAKSSSESSTILYCYESTFDRGGTIEPILEIRVVYISAQKYLIRVEHDKIIRHNKQNPDIYHKDKTCYHSIL